MAPQLYCWGPQSPGLELAALLGALVAVMVCFAGDLIGMAQGFLKVLQGKRDGRVRLIGLLLVAAIPYLAAAFLVERYAGDALHSPLVVGNALVWFGLLLYGTDRLGLTVRRIEHMTFGQASDHRPAPMLRRHPRRQRHRHHHDHSRACSATSGRRRCASPSCCRSRS